MKILLILLCPVWLFSQTTVEVAYKLRLSKNDYWGYETFVVFDSSTTDELDLCCDASTFGGPSTDLGIYTQIGSQYFLFNYFSQLTTDRVIDLHTFADPDTGTFVINVVDSVGYSNTILSLSDYLFPDQRFNFPYQTEGPITGQRFRLHTSAPVKLTVVNGCESDSGATLFITNPNSKWAEEILYENDLVFSEVDSQMAGLTSGNYQYRWYNQSGSQTLPFTVLNNPFNFTLIVPYTYLDVLDPGIIPEILIEGAYDQIIWDFGDGSPLRYDDTNPVHYYDDLGEYLLKVTVVSGSCSKTIEQLIVVDDVSGIPMVREKKMKPLYYYGLDGRLHRR